MDVLDILQKEWPLVAGAPVIAIGGALILLTAAFTAAWNLRSAINDGQIKQRDALVDTLKERLLLATDREQAVQRAREELEKQVQELKAQIAAGASIEALTPITAKVDTALGVFRSANNELQKALVTIDGKPVECKDEGDHLLIEHPDGGPTIIVPSKRPRDPAALSPDPTDATRIETLDVRLETAEQPHIRYKKKLQLVLQNMSDCEIIVGPQTIWKPGSLRTRHIEQQVWELEPPDGWHTGKWTHNEVAELPVPPGRAFRTWIGLHDSATESEIALLHGNLGTLLLPVRSVGRPTQKITIQV